MTAMETGELAGFLFYFDPDYNYSGQTANLAGNAGTYFEGIVYLPDQEVQISGNAEINTDSPLSVIVANTIDIVGNSEITFGVDEDKWGDALPSTMWDEEIQAYLMK